MYNENSLVTDEVTLMLQLHNELIWSHFIPKGSMIIRCMSCNCNHIHTPTSLVDLLYRFS